MEETFINNFKHTPVLLNECLSALNIKPDGIYVDGTLGGGGHSGEILKRLTTGRLIAFDKDDDALASTSQKLSKFGDKITYVKDDFKNMAEKVKSMGIEGVDGILLDLGVSSYQLDNAERGFSYRFDSRLDMRMDKTASLDAYDVVNTYSKEDLIRILYNYGEESFAKAIVNKIIEARNEKAIETTGELTRLIENAIPKKFWGRGSVAKKTFQAIRIEVNHELEGLDKAINQMIDLLSPSGRLAIITFHSLEDRIVKNVFKERSTNCICDKSIPFCVCNHKADVILVNKKPIEAGKEELEKNSRSSSAKLRVIQKI
ncbi:MAG: 16S rRNA (cytosine(1402)-N(4))-methyltransferase RsmH [Firmicutes bacterium]|nr:16S rRNA (cytosine(1402)-N(4))-methyltransferase RsmH [Bacillota bacterium]MDY5676845.1 16S rRNA (cytosine(1402)-N(4))-methyltransferase RsmH [Eubacteriales bacterium]